MIKANDAIAAGRALLGTPYSQLDCINFIKRIIRTAPGGVPGYTTAGTNTLWKSYSMSAKYRDLLWRQDGITGAQAGMLAFKRSGDDVHHVGLVTGDGTVLHSSSAKGCVVETALDSSWALLAKHRYIESADMAKGEEENMPEENVLFRARVATKSGPLNLRDEPGLGGSKIASVPRGTVVDVLDVFVYAEWWYVSYGGVEGYASAQYLQRVDEEAQEDQSVEIADGVTADAISATTLVREDAEGCIALIGRWHVSED